MTVNENQILLALFFSGFSVLSAYTWAAPITKDGVYNGKGPNALGACKHYTFFLQSKYGCIIEHLLDLDLALEKSSSLTQRLNKDTP